MRLHFFNRNAKRVSLETLFQRQGDSTHVQVNSKEVKDYLTSMGLLLNNQISISICPTDYPNDYSTGALFFFHAVDMDNEIEVLEWKKYLRGVQYHARSDDLYTFKDISRGVEWI